MPPTDAYRLSPQALSRPSLPRVLTEAKSTQTRLATISAATALIGVVVGGMIGYLTNRALQERESVTAARGAARVYQARLLTVAEDLTLMLETRRPFDLESRVPPDLDIDDKRLMASELSTDEWATVVRSESSMRQLLTLNPILTVNPVLKAPRVGAAMDATSCGVLLEQLHALEGGAQALSDLAEFDTQPTSQRRLDRLC